jgi:hypothetical protein
MEAEIPEGISFPLSQSYHLLHVMVSYAKLCCDLVLFDECINFLLFLFSCGTCWSTTAWLISDAYVSIFEVFTLLLTLMAPMQAFLYTQQSHP